MGETARAVHSDLVASETRVRPPRARERKHRLACGDSLHRDLAPRAAEAYCLFQRRALRNPPAWAFEREDGRGGNPGEPSRPAGLRGVRMLSCRVYSFLLLSVR